MEYAGRLTTSLAPAVRAIIMKGDCIAVHAESSGIKPLNWMVTSTEIDMPDYRDSDTPTVWRFATKKEALTVTLHDVLSDTHFILDSTEPGLEKTGTEVELQAWLADHPEALGDGYTFVDREYPTGAGPVDILARDETGCPVAVEVKRVASMLAVDQVSRYTSALDQSGEFDQPVKGLVVAFDVRPRARKLAEQRGFTWVELDKDAVLRDLA